MPGVFVYPYPKLYTTPFLSIANDVFLFAIIFVISANAVFTGFLYVVTFPVPSSPLVLFPKLYTFPDFESNKTCDSPADISTISSGTSIFFG